MNRKNPMLKWALIGGSAMVFIFIYLFNKTLKEDQERLYYYNSGTLPNELPTKTGNDDKVIEQKSDSIAMWRDRYLAAIAEKNQKGAVAGISQDSVDKLNKQIKYMENSIKNLNTEKGTLEKSNKSLTDSISNLNIRVVNLNSQIAQLNKEKGDLNTKNKTFEKSNKSLTDSISDLNKIVTDLNRQIVQLNKEKGDLNTKNKTFENTNKSLTDSISNLNKIVTDLNSQIEKLKEKGDLNTDQMYQYDTKIKILNKAENTGDITVSGTKQSKINVEINNSKNEGNIIIRKNTDNTR